MDTKSQLDHQTPSFVIAISPSIPSSELSVSGSGVSSDQASTRESSPELRPHSSSSSSSSDIEPICDELDLEDTMENQHRYNTFNSLPSPMHPGHYNTSNPGAGAVGPDHNPRAPSPHNQGFNPYNSTPLAPSLPHENQALSGFTGLSSHNPSHRGLTSSNWRTAASSSSTSIHQLQTSGVENYSSLLPSSLVSSYPEQQQQTFLGSHHSHQFYPHNQYHHQTPNSRPTTMSSPITMSSPASSPPSVCNTNTSGTGTGTDNTGSSPTENLDSAMVSYGGHNNNSSNDPSGHNNATNALAANSLLLAQLTHALSLSHGNGPTTTDMPFYGYCFDRGNGRYTRLIPADMLPPLVDIPARQQGCVGMSVVPCPTGLAPNGRSSNMERVLVQPIPVATNTLALRGGNGVRDPIQSRIDSIVATTPASPAIETTQLLRKQKIYCDKWIHEGVCAFTQQGCKYKHEMPLDKDTQESLGLFQGLPVWWRKHQGEISAATTTDNSQSADNISSAISSAVLTGGGRARASTGVGGARGGFGGQNRLRQSTWRSPGASGGAGQQQGGGIASGPTSPQGGGGRAGQGVAHYSSPFGPIAPPNFRRDFNNNTIPTVGTTVPRGSVSGPGTTAIVHRNPWGVLKSEATDDGDAKDTATTNDDNNELPVN